MGSADVLAAGRSRGASWRHTAPGRRVSRPTCGTAMAKKKTRDNTQFAALPFRSSESGAPQVMLVTSRQTRRWVIPKGWPIKGLTPPHVAAREAYEEAGLVGQIIGDRPIGFFQYEKQLPDRRLLCAVWVFLLRVDCQLDNWLEKGQRETRWFEPMEAAGLVRQSGLREIIRHAILTPPNEAGAWRRTG